MADVPWLAYLGVAEGLLGVGLAAVLVWRGRGRPGTLFLSGYLTWFAAILFLLAIPRTFGTQPTPPLETLIWFARLLLWLSLLGFVATHPHVTLSRRRAWYLVWVGLPLIATLAVLALMPSRIIGDDGGPQPFFQVFVTLLRDIALLVALVVFGRRWLTAEPGPSRRQYLFILLPFTLFALNDSMDAFLGVLGLRPTPRPEFGALAVLLVAGVLLLVALGLFQSRGTKQSGDPGAGLLCGWALFSFAASLLQFAGRHDAGNMLFLHFLVDGVGIVAQFYGVARYHILDIDLKFRLGIRSGVLGGIGLGIVIVVQQVIEQSFDNAGAGVAGGVAAGLAVLALHPIQRMAERVAVTAVPKSAETPEYLTFRRFEIYRAALEAAWLDGRVTRREHDILARLREELGIAADDAKRLEGAFTARSAPSKATRA